MSEALDWQQLLDTALTMPGNVGNVYNRFYNYSFMNQLLLLSQGVIEPVATYKRWQELGRQVMKGAKAKSIVRPVIMEKKDEAGDVESRSVRFKAVRCIFGFSETEGEELPPVELPRWNLETALDTLDIKRAPFYHLDGNVQGYSTGREVSVNPAAKYPTKTMFHECAHIVSGHTRAEEQAEYAKHRGIKEFEAEGSAYLVMNELELLDDEQASVSRGYLQHWLKDQRPSDTSIREVFRTTNKILVAGREV